ncbi:MAG: hypothetical protein MZW92_12060 [Comamonadaceae bacterium]|nr:hypothetical protein [Comamonadaceae bacterium]
MLPQLGGRCSAARRGLRRALAVPRRRDRHAASSASPRRGAGTRSPSDGAHARPRRSTSSGALLADVARARPRASTRATLPAARAARAGSRTSSASTASRLTLLFESFGFKHGVPLDADLVFDVRCLPNPLLRPAARGR